MSDFDETFKYYAYMISMPIIIILGLFGNVCIIVVCHLQKTVSTGYRYITFLAISDLLSCLLMFPWPLLHMVASTKMLPLNYKYTWNFFLAHISFVLVNGFMKSSTLLTCALTWDRYTALNFPLRYKSFSSPTKVIIIIFLCFAIAFGLMIPRTMRFKVKIMQTINFIPNTNILPPYTSPFNHDDEAFPTSAKPEFADIYKSINSSTLGISESTKLNRITKGAYIRYTFGLNEEYKDQKVFIAYDWCREVFLTILPLVIMIFLNTQIILKFREIMQKKRHMGMPGKVDKLIKPKEDYGDSGTENKDYYSDVELDGCSTYDQDQDNVRDKLKRQKSFKVAQCLSKKKNRFKKPKLLKYLKTGNRSVSLGKFPTTKLVITKPQESQITSPSGVVRLDINDETTYDSLPNDNSTCNQELVQNSVRFDLESRTSVDLTQIKEMSIDLCPMGSRNQGSSNTLSSNQLQLYEPGKFHSASSPSLLKRYSVMVNKLKSKDIKDQLSKQSLRRKKKKAKYERDEKRLTSMLICAGMQFFICSIPQAITALIDNPTLRKESNFKTIIVITNILEALNYMLNFYVYLIFVPDFALQTKNVKSQIFGDRFPFKPLKESKKSQLALDEPSHYSGKH